MADKPLSVCLIVCLHVRACVRVWDGRAVDSGSLGGDEGYGSRTQAPNAGRTRGRSSSSTPRRSVWRRGGGTVPERAARQPAGRHWGRTRGRWQRRTHGGFDRCDGGGAGSSLRRSREVVCAGRLLEVEDNAVLIVALFSRYHKSPPAQLLADREGWRTRARERIRRSSAG